MDIVIRTASGDAEVSVASPSREHVTVAEVVAAVTGAECPDTVFLNNVAISADQTLAEAGVLAGSAVSTVAPTAHPGAVVAIVQVAGPGAGATRALHPGRFRIGPGRRVTADELSIAPVDRAVATITVHHDGSVEVEGTAVEGAAMDRAAAGGAAVDDAGIGGSGEAGADDVDAADRGPGIWVEDQRLADRPVPWGQGMLLTPDRAFLHRPTTASGPDFGAQSTVLAALLSDAAPESFRATPIAADGTLAIPHETAVHEPAPRRSAARRTSGRGTAASEAAAPATPARTSAESGRPQRWIAGTLGAGSYEAMLGVRHGEPREGQVAGPGGSMAGITASLADSAGLGLVGSPDFTRGVARSVALQLATRHAPSDLRFVVATISEQLRAWEWMKWLPHARGAYGPLLFTTGAELHSWMANARDDVGLTLVLTDDPTWWTGRDAPLGPLLRHQDRTAHDRVTLEETAPHETSDDETAAWGTSGRATAGRGTAPGWTAERPAPRATGWPTAGAIARPIVMTGDASLLPAACTRTVTQRANDRALFRTPGHHDERMVPVLPPTWLATEAARRLAPYSDPDTGAARSVTAIDRPSLRDLLGAAAPAWARRGAALPRWSIPIGLSRVGGWVSLDPVAEGPDVLVAGSGELTGTGPVTESIVLSAAAMAAPADLAMALIEVEPRGTFERAERLPHTVTRLERPSRHEAWRFSRWLEGEVARRRTQLAELGVSSIDRLDAPPFPRLLIALDELVPVDPELAVFTDELARTVTGRGEIGLHLVVGTIRPGALAGHPLARTGSRIALRTATTHESEQIIGTPDAAGLPRFTPGHAILRTDETTVAFHPAGFATDDRAAVSPSSRWSRPSATAQSGAPADREPLTVRPFVIGREPSALEARLALRNEAAPDRSADPYADHLADTIVSAARSSGGDARHPRWFPPLPDEVPLATLLAADEGPVDSRRGVPFALVDLPAEHDQHALRWSPGHQSVIALGGATKEAGSALLAMLLAAASSISADDLHVYLAGPSWHVSSPDPSAGDPTVLPHVGGVVADERGVLRLARFLGDVVTARRAARPDPPNDEPAIAVFLEGLDTFGPGLSARGQQAVQHIADALVAGVELGVCAVISARRPDAALRTLIDRLGARLLSFDAEVERDASGRDRSQIPTLRPGRGVIVRPDGLDEFQLATPQRSAASVVERAMAHGPLWRPPVQLDGGQVDERPGSGQPGGGRPGSGLPGGEEPGGGRW